MSRPPQEHSNCKRPKLSTTTSSTPLQSEPKLSRLSPLISRMPNEVLFAIARTIQALPPKSAKATWKRDLSSLSRTSKAFTAICQQLIFESLTIRPSDFTADRPGMACHFDPDYVPKTMFGEVFPGLSTQLPSYVRTLTYRVSAGYTLDIYIDQESVNALEMLVSVSELRIEATTPPSKARPHLDVFFDSDGPIECALLKIMQGTSLRTLRLVNVRVPAGELSKCTSLNSLELDGSLCHSDSDFENRDTPVKGNSIYLNSFIYKGNYRRNEPVFLPYGLISNRLVLRWSELRTASLVVEDSNFKDKSEIPNHVLRNAKRLERLDLHMTRPSDPFGERDQECPIKHLHCDSFDTLTYLSFHIDYIVNHPREEWGTKTLQDPYHGLLKGGVIEKLVSLEELSFEIRFGGSSLRAVYEDETLLGDGWVELDRVLVPKGRRRLCERLRRVSLVYGTIPGCTNEDHNDTAFHRAFKSALTGFEGMKEVGREGVVDA